MTENEGTTERFATVDELRDASAQVTGEEAAEQAGLREAIRNATPDTPENRAATDDEKAGGV